MCSCTCSSGSGAGAGGQPWSSGAGPSSPDTEEEPELTWLVSGAEASLSIASELSMSTSGAAPGSSVSVSIASSWPPSAPCPPPAATEVTPWAAAQKADGAQVAPPGSWVPGARTSRSPRGEAQGTQVSPLGDCVAATPHFRPGLRQPMQEPRLRKLPRATGTQVCGPRTHRRPCPGGDTASRAAVESRRRRPGRRHPATERTRATLLLRGRGEGSQVTKARWPCPHSTWLYLAASPATPRHQRLFPETHAQLCHPEETAD